MKAQQKKLIVTDAQLQVIRDACELYGRIQIGQFREFAEIVTQTGFSGYELRIQPKKTEDETDERYKERCEALYEKDYLICDCLKGAVEGIYREVRYNYDKQRPNAADIALDIWAKLDGRREDGFHMGSEPLVKIEEMEES